MPRTHFPKESFLRCFMFDLTIARKSFMCLSPVKIVNPSRYVSLTYRDKLFIYVPCGHCSECQNKNKNEWLYRSFHECLDTFNKDGYLYLDCLTYRPSDVPMVSDFFDIPRSMDCMCFNREHLRSFFDLLRQKLRRLGMDYKNIRYFYACEYGTDSRYSHRPHVHPLFYLPKTIDPLKFSQCVSDVWKFGRTDGMPYKSKNYVLSHNVISSVDGANFFRVAEYVSKYVNKDSSFESRLYKRVMRIVSQKFNDVDSIEAKKYKVQVSRQINQFHSQSQFFGFTALDSIDLNRLERTGTLLMPSHDMFLFHEISLPMYYKRKLFYNLAYINGVPTWILNDKGVEYLNKRKEWQAKKLGSDLVTSYYNLSPENRCKVDLDRINDMVDYIMNYQGRVIGESSKVVSFADRLNSDMVFNYSNSADFIQFGKKFVSDNDLHNNLIGYRSPTSIYDIEDVPVYYDSDLEEMIYILTDKSNKVSQDKKALKYKSHMRHVKQYLLGR